MKNKLLLGLISLFGLNTIAQEQVSKQWKLDECIQYAYDNNLQVQNAGFTLNTTETQLKQSKSGLLPTLNGQATYGYNFGQTIDPYTNTFANSAVQTNNFFLSFNYDLFSGLYNYYNIQASELNIEASRQDVIKIKNDLALNIAGGYLDILFNTELLEIEQKQLEQSQLQLDRIILLFEGNQVAKSTMLDAKAEVGLQELDVVNATNNLTLSKIRLAQFLQLPLTEVENFDIEIPNLENVSFDANTKTPIELYDIAISRLPEVKGAEYRKLSAEQNIKTSQSGYFPRLSLSANVGTGFSGANKIPEGDPEIEVSQSNYFIQEGGITTPVYGYSVNYPNSKPVSFGTQLSDNFNQSLSLNLFIPIFNGNQNKYNVQQSKIRLEQSNIEIEQAKNQIMNDVYKAYAEAEAAFSRYTSAKTSVEALELSFDAMKLKYEQNLVTNVDYSDSRTKLTEAEANLSRAKYEYIFKMKVLDFYQGIPFEL